MTKVRLLTFEHLPLPAFNVPDEPWAEATWELTQLSTWFENYHLQHSPQDFLRDLETVNAAVGGRIVSAKSDVAPEEPDDTLKDLPFVALHCVSDSGSSEWPDEFASYVNHLAGLKRDGDEAVTIVTAIHGYQRDFPEFDSAVQDCEVRVPLWLMGANMTPALRTSNLAGSRDLLRTINQLLDVNIPPEDDGPSRSIDLRELMLGSKQQDRRMPLYVKDKAAIRTLEFLFVRDQDFHTSLYAKPTDVWNVHDVSGEFHDVVDELDAVVSSAVGSQNTPAEQ